MWLKWNLSLRSPSFRPWKLDTFPPAQPLLQYTEYFCLAQLISEERFGPLTPFVPINPILKFKNSLGIKKDTHLMHNIGFPMQACWSNVLLFLKEHISSRKFPDNIQWVCWKLFLAEIGAAFSIHSSVFAVLYSVHFLWSLWALWNSTTKPYGTVLSLVRDLGWVGRSWEGPYGVWAGALSVPQQGKQLHPVRGPECRKAPTRATPWQQNCQRLRNEKRLKTTAKQWWWAPSIFFQTAKSPCSSFLQLIAVRVRAPSPSSSPFLSCSSLPTFYSCFPHSFHSSALLLPLFLFIFLRFYLWLLKMEPGCKIPHIDYPFFKRALLTLHGEGNQEEHI